MWGDPGSIGPWRLSVKRIYDLVDQGGVRKYNLHMVTWDDDKRESNLLKHGFDFAGCEVALRGFTVTREDRRASYGERRFQTLALWRGVVVFIVHTPRQGDDHIISIRKADRNEQRIYWHDRIG